MDGRQYPDHHLSARQLLGDGSQLIFQLASEAAFVAVHFFASHPLLRESSDAVFIL